MNPLAAMLCVQAAQQGVALDIVYDGKPKTVEVHAVGPKHVRVFQIAGESSRPLPSWALLSLEKLTSASLTSTPSQAPREGYRKGDKQIPEIIYEL